MAIYANPEAVMAAIAYKVKVYNDALKDPVSKQILGTSPPVARKQYLSRSVDIAEKRMAAAATARMSEKRTDGEKKSKVQEEASVNSNAKGNVKKFEVEADAPNAFEFKELPVKAVPKTEPSLLAELIKSMPAQAPSSKGKEAVSRAERVGVKVFLPEGSMQVEVPKVATVGELIWSTIQQYEEDNRAPPLTRQTRAYLLKMAEEDGSQEDMVLKYTDKFFNFGLFFALVPNPAYESATSSAGREPSTLGRNSQHSQDRQTRAQKAGASLRKGTLKGRGKVNSSDYGAVEGVIENELLKIKMPDGSHTTVRLPDTAVATEVLEKCCTKRKFDWDRYHLEFVDDGENVPDSTTVSALKEKAIELVANSEIAGLDTYMSDRKAMQYEVFKVIKIKKGFNSNKQQERLLGIDSDRISNQAPEETVQNRSTFRKAFDGVRSGVMGNNNAKDGVKKGYWLMSDLCEAVQDPERNKQFILTFRDSTDATRQKVLTYRYEAETPKLAKQVVAKLTRLLELYNR